MKVYVVLCYDWSEAGMDGNCIHGIYSTRELALSALADIAVEFEPDEQWIESTEGDLDPDIEWEWAEDDEIIGWTTGEIGYYIKEWSVDAAKDSE